MAPESVTYGPDYDPEQGDELLYDSAGNPVTNDYLARLAYELETEGTVPAGTTVEFHTPGRPSLTGPRQKSPAVHFRVPAHLRDAVEQRAEREGKSVSSLAREALERYVSRPL